jgi:hypothetical protein
MGMIYKRGEICWIKYYSSGSPIRESSHSSIESDAKRLLRDREGRVEMGAPKYGTGWSAAIRGHEDFRTQNGKHLSSICDRERVGHSGRDTSPSVTGTKQAHFFG